MDNKLKKQLISLGLRNLLENWDDICIKATKQKVSYHRFLSETLSLEYELQQDKKRLARIKNANIPELWVMQTYPFARQPKLNKKTVLELYDSERYLTEPQQLIFIGPTGCGKTGLATAFLTHALDRGYRGCFIDFARLLELLLRSKGDHTEAKVVKKFKTCPVLLIDDWGYEHVGKEVAGLLFEIIKGRHRKTTTLITTQFGFDEWNTFIDGTHMVPAILDRLLEKCTVFNLQNTASLRKKNIVYANKCTS